MAVNLRLEKQRSANRLTKAKQATDLGNRRKAKSIRRWRRIERSYATENRRRDRLARRWKIIGKETKPISPAETARARHVEIGHSAGDILAAFLSVYSRTCGIYSDAARNLFRIIESAFNIPIDSRIDWKDEEKSMGNRKKNKDRARHPMQPLELDESRVLRFKENKVVVELLAKCERGEKADLNTLAREGFSAEDWAQFLQLIGYSVAGYPRNSVVDEAAIEAAKKSYKEGRSQAECELEIYKERFAEIKKLFAVPVAELYERAVEDFK